MADTTFVPGTVIASTWLNDVNDTVYDLLGDGTLAPVTKADIRTNLGLGTIATQAANNVAITGGTISGVTVTGLATDLAVADGGTGASTPAAARTNLGFTSAVIDRAYASYNSTASITTVIPADNSIPQNTEGTQILTASITPKSITNRVRVRFTGSASATAISNIVVALFVGAGANAVQVTATTIPAAAYTGQLALEFEHVPGVLTATSYSIRVGPGAAGTIVMNSSTGGPWFAGSSASTLVVEEIAV